MSLVRLLCKKIIQNNKVSLLFQTNTEKCLKMLKVSSSFLKRNNHKKSSKIHHLRELYLINVKQLFPNMIIREDNLRDLF
jgi:hypothetical protein